MKYFISFLIMPILLSAQIMEDIFEEDKFMYLPNERSDWSEKIEENYSYIYHFVKFQLKFSENLKTESKNTSIYLYHKGQADAYKDVLKFMYNLPAD